MTMANEAKARLHSVNRFACCAMTRCHATNALYRGRPPGTLALRLRALRCATAHGFRATASTILNEHGFRPDVIERHHDHVERNRCAQPTTAPNISRSAAYAALGGLSEIG